MSKSLSHLKLKLEGFNNLTKSLSFNIYNIRYTPSILQRNQYLQHIDKQYNSAELSRILSNVAEIIGGTILNIASQDYEPQGASVTMLIADEPVPLKKLKHEKVKVPNPRQNVVVAHLNKSHIAVHTYPESHPQRNISTFRADIDISTCGHISPLSALNYLIRYFDADIVIMDYRVRGFTCDTDGHKHFIDHDIDSIQNYIDSDIKEHYQALDVNTHTENIFHTKMAHKNFSLNRYLLDAQSTTLTEQTKTSIESYLRHEILEIFHGKHIHS